MAISDSIRVPASAYKFLTQEQHAKTNNSWRKIWKWKGTERVKTFMWRVMHGRILIAERKAKMMGANPICHNCRNQKETIIHALRDFPKAAAIWLRIINPTAAAVFFSLDLQNWLNLNLEHSLGVSHKYDWLDEFFITCWWIWNWRNKEMHSPPFVRPTNVVPMIRSTVEGILKAYKRDKQTSDAINSNNIQRKTDGWRPPPFGWTKLNTDGAVDIINRQAVVVGCLGRMKDSGLEVSKLDRETVGSCKPSFGAFSLVSKWPGSWE